ncbi:PP0621 family protein [Helicobacter sp. 11S02596-1]|uniref:PP0621 family protein n=1 Tax=Helicobacter sp. 11S02596-1 TaxID=1476194 RepID=UPI000BA5A121|nr:PP0621 family protein [Helicobacter sp. 11S02596-1]PAF42466.1 hypothetical protein BJI48_06595 [Helicobacter sp. 11S02596-1]
MKFLILLVLIGGVIWFFFFRKISSKPPKKHDEELMVACRECGTYVAFKEAILYNGEYFCSPKCLNHKTAQ